MTTRIFYISFVHYFFSFLEGDKCFLQTHFILKVCKEQCSFNLTERLDKIGGINETISKYYNSCI